MTQGSGLSAANPWVAKSPIMRKNRQLFKCIMIESVVFAHPNQNQARPKALS
jgi:hypothetical protein